MLKIRIISTLILALILAASGQVGGKRSDSQRIGDLVMTLLGFEERASESSNEDHHAIVIRVRAENLGKQALCVYFHATLKATFDLKYSNVDYLGAGLRTTEFLPGEKTEGEYGFSMKNGVKPLRFILVPFSEIQTCGGRDSFSSALHYRDSVEFDVTRPLSDSKDQTIEKPLVEGQTRVFVTDADGRPEAKALKAFHDHCPLALLTTEKEKANYFVELSPASLKRSKNMVVVTNRTGDIIHSGTAFNLGNAAKDACSAILKDFQAIPK